MNHYVALAVIRSTALKEQVKVLKNKKLATGNNIKGVGVMSGKSRSFDWTIVIL